MSLITDTDALAALCERVARSEFVTIDTEFIRDKTYWSQLCLVQIAGEDEAVAVDTLAPDIDLAPLFALLTRPKPLKVFHAARQDVEIFFNLSGEIPAPIFDTQVAAMVCGFGDSVGYDKLVAKLARQHIDKALRFTDWARRPLSKRLLDYALSDVTHLRVVYEKLARQLNQNGRAEWLAEEMELLTAPATYRQDPEQAWRRIKTRMRKPRHLAILRELASWREGEAQRRDIPRNRVVREEALTEIAAHEPETAEELNRLRSMKREQLGKAGTAAVLDIVRTVRQRPDSTYPEIEAQRPSDTRLGPSVDLLKVLLKLRCEQHKVAQKLVATTDQIEAIARDDDADVPALHGWRREIFGGDALALKQGKLALTADGRGLRVIDLDR